MAQYDGSVRINTEIETKKAKIQLTSMENRIVKAADKVDSLRSKMDALKDVKTPTQEYKDLQKELSAAEKELGKMAGKEKELSALDVKIEKLAQSSSELAEKMNSAEFKGDASDEYKILESSIKQAKYELEGFLDEQKRLTEKGFVKQDIDKQYLSAQNAVKSLKRELERAVLSKDEDAYLGIEDRLNRAKSVLEDLMKKDPKPLGEMIYYYKVEKKIENLKNSISESENKMKKLTESGNAFSIDTDSEDYKNLESEYKAVNQELERAKQQQGDLIEKQAASSDKVDEIKAKMNQLVDEGKAFTLGSDSEEFSKLGQQLKYAENDLNLLNEKYNLQSQKLKKISGETDGAEKKYSKLRDTVKKLSSVFDKITNVIQKTAIGAFKKLGSVISGTLKKATSVVGALSGKIKALAQKHMPRLRKETSKTNSSFSTFGRRIKELLLSALIFNRISAALNSLVSGAKEGLNNLVMYSDRVNDSMSMLMSSMTRLKNSLATAFAPILNVVAPILSRFIDLISEAATKVGMFFAALTGQTTFEKAIKVQQDYRESLEGTAKAEKEAAKEQDKYLSGLDEIRRWESNKDEDEEDELKPEDMFTTVPVENSMVELADKVKDVFKKLFAPLKKAWNREGKFVMDSWKYALKEVWKLAKDIGRDFLKVWNQEATIAMLADMLHIIGDIGLIVGNLAGKFREAWNYNNTGLHILENIRDIFAVIIHNIREAADYTVEWTKTLDFRPLLTSIENVTSSLIRFADFVSGTLVDFYTEFILPLASWSLSEQGLPRLFNILASFMDSINWEGLRSSLKSLYQALEPYAEEIGNGLIDFIEKMKDEGVEFFNFLPGAIQRAADALRAGDLPAAFMEFGSISGEAVKMAFNNIRHAIESINWGEIGTLIASFINGIDWMGVGQSIFGALSSAVNSAIDLIYNFITTTDWRAIGAAFGTNLSNAWASIDWGQAGATVGEAFKAFFNFIAETIENIDWFMVGQSVKDFLVNIDWAGIAQAVFEAIGAAFYGWNEFIGGLIYDGIKGAIEYFQDKIEECGGNIVLGILKGIIDGIAGIAQWIVDNVFKPFMDGFKKAFGIHSPSTVMQEQGGYIVEGIRKGIADKWTGFVQFWTEKKNQLIDKFNDVKEKFLTKGRNIVDGIKGGISEKWGDFTTFWGNKKENLVSKFNDIKEKIAPKGRDIVEGIRNGINGDWGSFDGFLGQKKDDIPGKFSNIKNDMEGIGRKIVNGIIGGIQSIWSSLTNIAGKIADLFNINIKAPSVSTGGRTSSSSRRAARSVEEIPYSTMSALATAPIPYLATGAVIPPNREFMAVLGDQKQGNNIEAPESLLRKIVREETRGNQSGGGNYRFTANLNRRVIFDEIIEEAKLRQTVSGRNPFEMA